jgi:hypothetical protein
MQVVLAIVLLYPQLAMDATLTEKNPKTVKECESIEQEKQVKREHERLHKNLLQRIRYHDLKEGFERLRAVLPKTCVRLNQGDLILNAIERIKQLEEELDRPPSPEFVDVKNLSTHLIDPAEIERINQLKEELDRPPSPEFADVKNLSTHLIDPAEIEKRIEQLMKTLETPLPPKTDNNSACLIIVPHPDLDEEEILGF